MPRKPLDADRTLKLVLEYEGTNYAGWQIQTNAPSVQGELENACREVLGHDARVHGAGRTDAGVHALEQVAHLATRSAIPLEELTRALNARLARDIAVKSVAEAPEGFHARFSARGKIYAYTVRLGRGRSVFDRRVAWSVPYALDLDAVREGASALTGRHDFRGFASVPKDASAVRDVRSFEVIERPPYLLFLVEAEGFLWKMVRRMAGALVTVGRGKEGPQWIHRVLESRGDVAGGPTAPAGGLTLVRVIYGDAPFAHEVPWPPWPCFFLAARDTGQ